MLTTIIILVNICRVPQHLQMSPIRFTLATGRQWAMTTTRYNNNILYSSQREIKAVVRSHNEEHSNSKSWNTHIHTLRHTLPFSQSAYNNSKPKITWNNAFSVKPKRKNSQIKIIRFTHPQPTLRKLSSSTDVLTHAHTHWYNCH